MRALTSFSTLAALALLAACATPQQSPIYQHSSAYPAPAAPATVQSASYTQPAAPDIYTRVAPTCTATPSACSPQAIAGGPAPSVAQPWASPTGERFAGGEGTPGFRAVSGSLQGDAAAPLSAPLAAPLSAPLSAQAPAPTTVDIQTLTISGPIVAAESLSGTQTRALMHRVEEGDTVYSLSRRYCTGVDAIRSLNGLGADYAIALGANLKVPFSCR